MVEAVKVVVGGDLYVARIMVNALTSGGICWDPSNAALIVHCID